MNRHPTSAITHLEMVDSPISNTQAGFIEGMADELPHLRRSDFYMLTARPAARFANIVHDVKNNALPLDICDHRCFKFTRINVCFLGLNLSVRISALSSIAALD